MKTLKLY